MAGAAEEGEVYVALIDQGTTSTRFIVYGHHARPVASHQLEFKQHYPEAGGKNIGSTVMPRFNWWFGIDLNEPADAHVDGAGASAGRIASAAPDETGDPPVPPNTATYARSDAHTGVTLSSEESGSDGDVQSTPEGFVPKTPYVGMMFDSPEAALVHYNRYATPIDMPTKELHCSIIPF